MKKQIFNGYFLLLLCFSFITFSCNKSAEVDDNISEEVQVSVQSEDAEMISTESESVDDDASNAVSSSARFCGTGNIFGGGSLAFDLDTSNPGGGARFITLNYNGTVYGCRKRTGSIVLELLNATRWVEPGATLKVSFINFKVENICRNKSVSIIGERYITNVNGGNLFTLSRNLVASLKHKVRTGSAGLTVTFIDSFGTKTAKWNVARTTNITYSPTPQKYSYEILGDTTINGKSFTEAWGTTRFNKTYQTVINTAIKANTVCKLWKPVAGVVTNHVNNLQAQVLFGLNMAGNPVGIGDCAGFYKVTFTNTSGAATSRLFAYR